VRRMGRACVPPRAEEANVPNGGRSRNPLLDVVIEGLLKKMSVSRDVATRHALSVKYRNGKYHKEFCKDRIPTPGIVRLSVRDAGMICSRKAFATIRTGEQNDKVRAVRSA